MRARDALRLAWDALYWFGAQFYMLARFCVFETHTDACGTHFYVPGTHFYVPGMHFYVSGAHIDACGTQCYVMGCTF